MGSIPHHYPPFSCAKACKNCGVVFTLTNPNQRFCCEPCRLVHHFGPPRPCAHCGAIFQPRWKANDYCGVACHDLAQRRGPDLMCEHCGRTFRRPDALSKAYKPRFCCWACLVQAASTRRAGSCAQCGGSLPALPPSELRRRRFCSIRCAADARRSPTPRRRHGYDRRYDAWRAAVVARDRVCRQCGASQDLHAHHIYGWTDYPERRYDLDNGLLLCRPCHQLRHPTCGVGGPRRKRE